MADIGQPIMEFHVSRLARDRYGFAEALYASSGNVIFGNFHAARIFAQRMNARRDLLRFPEQAIRAGQINAMGLIDEIMHMVVNLYRQQKNPQVMQDALDWLYGMLGQETVDAALRQFAVEFPPLAVYRRAISPGDYLESSTGGIPNRQILLEELLLLWLANTNPAFTPFIELFDATNLDRTSAYRQILPSLHAFFETQPPFGPDSENLIDMLRSPAIAVPHSLSGQIEYIRSRWGLFLSTFLYRLLSSLDLIREEEKATFLGPGPSRVYEFAGMELEPERFSLDKDWMPSLVLMAKNAYVWLDQLSKKYARNIFHLDHIPDEELDVLSRWGFSGLWLIGLWERSQASKRIKQLRGNPEAVASAYSLFEYQIAEDLGGEEAYANLRERAWRRGLRLASDMVPNHMGIDSPWVINHPEWFISLDYSPFPSYTFNGPNLSWDNQVGIFIEDHYFDSTDAAVVFKRVDNWNGGTRFIYHGNDGTSMPWNDTAQLNYLNPEVREAVIQTILSVARKFPVIRFDAAMTLAKKHFQRLWFPEPGSGGAIPSRAEFGMTREQFDTAVPVEFWREVVDRVAQEAPDTLLLAEAFWLMEGYFVRTLGMHRVYNSAFMNMLRDEKNAEYRLVIKNTLEFDPEILKRYVNFMNNPDERTAVEQFGKGDKYFGICTLMATMPGLPMFGHGQVEGFTEKYGMEYRRAYWDESPDGYLVERHAREIFPLLRKRYLFAEVKDFLLYDFFSPEGFVNEDVYAYTNRAGDEHSLVLYHNKYATARGWIRTSAATSQKMEAGERLLVQKGLGEGLDLQPGEAWYVIFRDQVAGLEYIRSNREIHEKGLFVELEAYQYHVFTGFRQVQDNEWRQYAHLVSYLDGRGVPSVDEALKEIFLQPIHYPFRALVNAGFLKWCLDNRSQVEKIEKARPAAAARQTETQAEITDRQRQIMLSANLPLVLDEAESKLQVLLEEIRRLTGAGTAQTASLAHQVRQALEAVLRLPDLASRFPKDSPAGQALDYLYYGSAGRPAPDGEPGSGLQEQSPSGLLDGDPVVWGTLLGWLFTHSLGKVVTDTESADVSRSWVDEWLLGKILAGALGDLGLDETTAWRAVGLIKILIGSQGWCTEALSKEKASLILQAWLQDREAQQYLGINRHGGVLWFNKESFDNLLWWMHLLAVVEHTAAGGVPAEELARTLAACHAVIHRIQQAEEKAGFQVEKLLEAVK
jgi:glycosidase